MKYFPLSILFCLLAFFFVVPLSFASAPQITASPSGTINLDESFTLTATMSGLSKNATYRLRVAISQPGETVYFGSTFDGTNWHMGSLGDGNFIAVTTDASGSWSGNIQGKVDSEDPNFTTGSGTYDLKIGRYTQTSTTATWSDPVSITLYVPPIPTPTPTPTPTQAPVQTSVVKLTPTPTKFPTFGITKIPTSMTSFPTASVSAGVLGVEVASVSPQISKPPKQLVKNASRKSFPLVVFVSGAILLIAGSAASGMIVYRKRKQSNGESV